MQVIAQTPGEVTLSAIHDLRPFFTPAGQQGVADSGRRLHEGQACRAPFLPIGWAVVLGDQWPLIPICVRACLHHALIVQHCNTQTSTTVRFLKQHQTWH